MSDERDEAVGDLAYIGQALQRLIGEVASLRDDMHVLTAIVQRLDNSQRRMFGNPCHAHLARSFWRAPAPARGTALIAGASRAPLKE